MLGARLRGGLWWRVSPALLVTPSTTTPDHFAAVGASPAPPRPPPSSCRMWGRLTPAQPLPRLARSSLADSDC